MADELDFSQLANVFIEASEEAENISKQATNTNAEDLLSVSKELAPLDEGGLMENGAVEPAVKQGKNITAYVGYDKEYALRMHEDVYEAQVPGKGRKYLENPTKQNGQKYADYLAKKMGEAFK